MGKTRLIKCATASFAAGDQGAKLSDWVCFSAIDFEETFLSRNLVHKTNPRFCNAISSGKTSFKTSGPCMVRSRVVSNHPQKESIPSEKRFLVNGTAHICSVRA